MKHLLLGFILLLLSIWLGLEVSRSAGYVLITYRHWSIETSLWVSLIVLLFSFGVFYCFLRLLNRTFSLSSRLSRWKRMRRYRRARRITDQGLCALAEGHWEKAENTLLKAAKMTKWPLMNYLSAARAAQAQKAYDRRDNHFRQAYNTTKNAGTAIDLTQAKLQIESAQWDQALATLQHLERTEPHHPRRLELLKEIYENLNDWAPLQALLPELKKQNALSSSAFTALEESVYVALLKQPLAKSLESLKAAWKATPRRWQQNEALLATYTEALIHYREDETAITLIEQALKKSPDLSLFKQYSMACGENSAKQLTQAEQWLKKHPKNPALLLCLGRLSIREKFWGKAKEYLQSSIGIKPSVEAYHELGSVFEALDDQTAALKAYQQGLALALQKTT